MIPSASFDHDRQMLQRLQRPDRCVVLADAFGALGSHRSYRPGVGVDPALNIIAQPASSRFDPKSSP